MKSKVVTVNADIVYSRGGRIFVISDLHGNWDDFINWQNSVGFNVNDFCIVNGDAIDRGPFGIKLLKYFMSHSNNFLFLMGNHEELMLGAIDECTNKSYSSMYLEWWLMNGGDTTMVAFCDETPDSQAKILSFLNNAPYVAEIKSFVAETIYVSHAGLTKQWLQEAKRGHLSFVDKNMHNITWARQEWWQMPHDLDGLSITGHTSTTEFGGTYGEVLFDGVKRIVIDCNTNRSHRVGYVCVTSDNLVFTS